MAWTEIANIRGPQGEAADVDLSPYATKEALESATLSNQIALAGQRQRLDDLEPEVRARPAFWLWDGTAPWTPPPFAQAGDTVLNTATMEVHRVEEVA